MHMYNFKKDISYEHTTVFKNPLFRRNEMMRLSFIKRKPLRSSKKYRGSGQSKSSSQTCFHAHPAGSSSYPLEQMKEKLVCDFSTKPKAPKQEEKLFDISSLESKAFSGFLEKFNEQDEVVRMLTKGVRIK
jgi:hypothetical protein